MKEYPRASWTKAHGVFFLENHSNELQEGGVCRTDVVYPQIQNKRLAAEKEERPCPQSLNDHVHTPAVRIFPMDSIVKSIVRNSVRNTTATNDPRMSTGSTGGAGSVSVTGTHRRIPTVRSASPKAGWSCSMKYTTSSRYPAAETTVPRTSCLSAGPATTRSTMTLEIDDPRGGLNLCGRDLWGTARGHVREKAHSNGGIGPGSEGGHDRNG